MTKKQAEGLKLSIEHFGVALPFLISPQNDIYDGHQRQTLMNAMREHGGNAEVDVRVSSRLLTDDERRELIIRLKQNQAGWDFDMLPNLYEREELLEWGFELEELGMFDDVGESADAEPQIDRAEELRKKWGVESGQLWRLGDHRLICGDCTDAAVVARVMGGEKADICVSDPPYGVLDNEWDRPFNQIDLDIMLSVSSGLVACFNAAKPSIVYEVLSLIPQPERIGVWRYSNIAPKPGMIWSWQPVFYWRCKDAKAWDSLDWYQGNADRDGTHPTQKPVDFFTKIIQSVECDSVYDPFLGSGTTMIACENLGRRCRAVEIAPGYVAVALQRMEDAFPGILIERVE